MTPDELISRLASWKVTLSRPTLLRYQKQGLISEPTRGSSGRGIGKWTNYPDIALVQSFAAWSLLHGEYGGDELQIFFQGKPPALRPESVAIIKKEYFHETDKNPNGSYFQQFTERAVQELLDVYILLYRDLISKAKALLERPV